MDENTIISIQDFCSYYDVPVSFLDELSDYELITFYEKNNVKHIRTDELELLEKLIRLHFDLDINFEGLDVILNLLNKISELQTELNTLQAELKFYKKSD
ncbi:MAG: hypothetical protein GXO50_06770 [Chlorobi bacterium]|nr:hypothetical protein [Chlorobiota bacterium]